MSVYDYSVLDQKGTPVSLEKYRGKVLLIVNTATKCGFTKQYEGLENMYKKYQEKGFEILDFPCNQFFGQAPGTNEEINEFCSLKFRTTFPRFDKIEVNGKNTIELYKFLKLNEKGKEVRIKWNFTKFLIDQEGKVIARFEPGVTPEEIDPEIAKIL